MREDLDDLLGHRRRHLGCRDALQDDRELVAAQPRHQIAGAHATGDALRDGLEQEIARFMTQGVVDDLEAVEVQEQDGVTAGIDRPPREQRDQALPEQHAVGEAGQGIMKGEPPHALFGAARGEQARDALAQNGEVQGLRDIVGGPGAEGAIDGVLIVEGGDDQHRNMFAGAEATDPGAGREPVRFRHVRVHQNEIRHAALAHGQRLGGPLGLLDTIAVVGEDAADDEAGAGVIIDDEDARAFGGLGTPLQDLGDAAVKVQTGQGFGEHPDHVRDAPAAPCRVRPIADYQYPEPCERRLLADLARQRYAILGQGLIDQAEVVGPPLSSRRA